MAKLDEAKYNAVMANTVNQAVIDAGAIAAWREDLKQVVDGNDSTLATHVSHNVLDGVHGIYARGIGQNISQLSSGTDLDDIEQTGFYAINNHEINRPYNWGTMQHYRTATYAAMQLVFPTLVADLPAYRIKNTDVWAGWRRMPTMLMSDNPPNGAVSAAPGSFCLTPAKLWLKMSGAGNTGWREVTLA